MPTPAERAAVLSEALPYIREYHGRTVVIKYGGHAMVDEDLMGLVLRDVVLLHYVGIRPIIVHGGGPEVSELMRRLGKTPTFVDGLRVTDAETIEIAEMVLAGKTNKGVVSLINQSGGRAVGLSGKDGNLIRARKMTRGAVDMGFVGEVVSVDPSLLHTLADASYIPVICPVAVSDEGETLNINADLVAGDIAAAVSATKLILLTDIEGVLEDKSRPETLLSTLSLEDARRMVDEGKADKGMIPKLQSCITALQGGVESAHIIDGRVPHSLVVEIFTDLGIGTMVTH
ncbi:MAG TPA: acetylglutamate kinase [Armatimonadota bacterium]|jgi:acetylglutamate kinase